MGKLGQGVAALKAVSSGHFTNLFFKSKQEQSSN